MILAQRLLVFAAMAMLFAASPLIGSETEPLKVQVERNVPVPMRDGVILRADVYRPERDHS